MPLQLYYHPFSSYCQKVMIAFYENAIAFEPQLLAGPDCAATKALAELWPIKRFPLLVDEERGATIMEASCIMEYLGLHRPGPVRLLPEDAQAALEVRMLDRFFDNYVSTPQQKLVFDALRPPEQRKQVEIARQDMQIAIANKSKEQSVADALANQARADAVKAEEGVNTARQVAVAERERSIQLIEASKEAEQLAIAVKVSASAEKEAALDRAEAITIEAKAKQAAAIAEAEGRRAINEALNTLSAAQIDLQVRTLLLQQLPAVIEQAVRPMEKIDSIRIFQVNGMPGGGQAGNGDATGTAGNGTFPEQVMNSALQYQIAKPIVDAVMKDAGLSNEGITGMAQSLAGMLQAPAAALPTAQRDA